MVLYFPKQKNTSPNPHPVMARVVDQLHQKGTLLAFWTNSLDPKLQPLTKSKGTIALNLLKHALQVVEDEQVCRFKLEPVKS